MTENQSDYLPPFFQKRHVLIWGFIAPQIVLIVLNLRGWWLIKGEMNAIEQQAALWLFIAELAILCLNTGVFFFLNRRKEFLNLKISIALLLIHIAYMWSLGGSRIVPSDLPAWIITEFDFFAWNITFFMPGAFLSLYIIACTPLPLTKGKDAAYTIITIFAVPLVFYLSMTTIQPFFLSRLPEVLGIFTAVCFTALFFAALLRLFTIIIDRIRNKGIVTHYLLVITLGIAAPLGGLYLNRLIPFPADFQSTGVYVMTLLNGLILLPRPDSSYPLIRLFGRAVTYPFIFYFFLVFLPFLPLAILAIIVLGAGFLVLTPVALGAFQTKIIADDFRIVETGFGRKIAILITLTGVSVMPIYFFCETLLERSALYDAIDSIYAADFDNTPTIELKSSQRAARALVKLRDRKQGVRLPYISGFYNYMVFGNMVLPDNKIERMYRLLTGNELPEIRKNDFLSSQIPRRSSWDGGRIVQPTRNVILETVETEQKAPDRAKVKLVMRNQTENTHSEYIGSIVIPEGVFVTGLNLKIEDTFVPGKIFDRKTAMWVYQKITEFRQDPALLIYRSPGMLELRIYPFPAKGIREAEIEFFFPAKAKGKIVIDGQNVELNPSGSDSPLYVAGEYVAMQVGANLPNYTRSAYLHVILDFSNGSEKSQETYLHRILILSERLKIPRVRLSAANLDYARLSNGEILDVKDEHKISESIKTAQISYVGGFWAEKAINREMKLFADETGSGDFHNVPVFALVTGKKMCSHELKAIDFSAYAFITPDVTNWYIDDNGSVTQYSFSGNTIDPVLPPEISPVVAARRGAKTTVINPERPALADLPGNEPLKLFDARLNDFVAQDAEALSDPRTAWKKHAVLWEQWREAALNPARMEKERVDLLKQSRSVGMVIPSTSFIVVENSAQSRILERKEAQSLANKGALEFEEKETPEPSGWILLFLLIALMFSSRFKWKYKCDG